MRTGYLLVLIGILFLIHESGLLKLVTWPIIWPTLLIIAGLLLIFDSKYAKKHIKFRRLARKD